jgi:hypothetical protein
MQMALKEFSAATLPQTSMCSLLALSAWSDVDALIAMVL